MAPVQTPPQQTEAQQDQYLTAEAAMVIGTAITVSTALDALAALFAAAGITRAALRGALSVVLAFPPDPLGAHGPAQRRIFTLNVVRRAQFLVAAGRRITADLTAARSHSENTGNVLDLAMARERRYYAQHIAAISHRSLAAARVDSAAMMYGPLIGWYTVHDAHTTPDCLAADGKNFWAGQPPLIGYPGTAHPRCRCWPGRPHPGGKLLASARMAA